MYLFIDTLRPVRLEQYLYDRGERQAVFAKRAGIPQSAVSRVCNGGDVRGRFWARIAVASGGKVRPEHHFPVSRVAA